MYEFFKSKLLAANAFNNVTSEFQETGGDILHIPKYGDSFTAYDIDVTSGNISPESITDTGTTLTVDKWIGDSVRLPDFQLAQAAKSYKVRERHARHIAYNIARKFDKALLNKASAGLSLSLGDSTSALNATNLEKAMGIMESTSVPRDELSLIIHPRSYFGDLFKNAKFYDASQFGKSTLPSGKIDTIYNIPVYRTPNIEAYGTSGANLNALKNMLVHPEVVWYAFGNPNAEFGGGLNPGVRVQELPAEAHRKTLAGDVAYGMQCVRSGAGVVLYTENNR